MKRYFNWSVIILLSFMLSQCAIFKKSSSDNKQVFDITFVQSGKNVIIEKNNAVRLKPSSFTMHAKFNGTTNVYLSVIDTPHYYNMPEDSSLVSLKDIWAHVYAEYPHNKSRDIVVDRDHPFGFHRLLLESEDKNHGFDRVEINENLRQGWRSVDSLFVMHNFDNREKLHFNDFSKDLYLVFLSIGENEKGEKIETQRTKYQIIWDK